MEITLICDVTNLFRWFQGQYEDLPRNYKTVIFKQCIDYIKKKFTNDINLPLSYKVFDKNNRLLHITTVWQEKENIKYWINETTPIMRGIADNMTQKYIISYVR